MHQKEVLVIVIVIIGLSLIAKNSEVFSGRAVADDDELEYITRPQGTQEILGDPTIADDNGFVQQRLEQDGSIFSGVFDVPPPSTMYDATSRLPVKSDQLPEENVGLTAIFSQANTVACNELPKEVLRLVGGAC